MINNTKATAQKSICQHCGKEITQVTEKLWHDDSKVFPQYCVVDFIYGSRLHTPSRK